MDSTNTDLPVRPTRRRWNRSARLMVLATSSALVVLAGACSGTSASKPATAGSTPAAEAAGGEAAGGEAAGVRFESALHGYRVDSPGVMTEASDGTASSRGGGEQLSIVVVSGSAATDMAAYAKSDLASVSTTATNFHEKSPLGGAKLSASKSSLKAVYSATRGTSAVTGKPDDVVVVKYFVPRDSSEFAVLTYTVTANQYDPQGADDIANTFGWL